MKALQTVLMLVRLPVSTKARAKTRKEPTGIGSILPLVLIAEFAFRFALLKARSFRKNVQNFRTRLLNEMSGSCSLSHSLSQSVTPLITQTEWQIRNGKASAVLEVFRFHLSFASPCLSRLGRSRLSRCFGGFLGCGASRLGRLTGCCRFACSLLGGAFC